MHCAVFAVLYSFNQFDSHASQGYLSKMRPTVRHVKNRGRPVKKLIFAKFRVHLSKISDLSINSGIGMSGIKCPGSNDRRTLMAASFAALSSSAHIKQWQPQTTHFSLPATILVATRHSSHIAIALSLTISAGSINQKRGVHGKQRKRRGVSADCKPPRYVCMRSSQSPHSRNTRTTSEVSASPGRIGGRAMRLASPGQGREVPAMAGAPLRERSLVNFVRMLMGALWPRTLRMSILYAVCTTYSLNLMLFFAA
jgi:hypothetical protein